MDAPTDLIVSVVYNRTKAPPTPLPHLLPVRFGYFDPSKSPTTFADGRGPAYGDAHKHVNVTLRGTNFAPPTRGMACAVELVSPSDLLMTARRDPANLGNLGNHGNLDWIMTARQRSPRCPSR